MLYVLDANVLITARDQYYGFNMIPEFWEWLLHHAEAGTVKLPWEVIEEVSSGSDQKKGAILYSIGSATRKTARSWIWARPRSSMSAAC